jgi:hypothetical protein
MTDQVIQGIDLAIFDDNNLEINKAALTSLITKWKISERETVMNYALHKALGNKEMLKSIEDQQRQAMTALANLKTQAEEFNKLYLKQSNNGQ